MLNKLPFLSTLLRTWKYIRTVLCNNNTSNSPGNTCIKYFTLSLVRVCKALPGRFWGVQKMSTPRELRM